MIIKDYLAKYFTNLASIITLVGVIFLGWYVYNETTKSQEERLLLEKRYGRLIDTNESLDKITETITQLATSYKEQAQIAKDVALAWKDLAIEREERIKLTQSTEVSVDEAVAKQTKHDYAFLTKQGSQGYTINELRINGETSPPIGYIMIKNDGEVIKKNYKFNIRLESVQLKDDLTGKIRVATKAYLIPLENGLAEKRRIDLKKWVGEKYPLNVSGGEITVDPHEPVVPIEKKKDFIPLPMNINPGIGVFGYGNDVYSKFTLDTNIYGYGRSKRDLDWKLGNFGINYSDKIGLGFHVMPFTYRLFPNTFTNSYTGIGWHTDGDQDGYFLGINVGL